MVGKILFKILQIFLYSNFVNALFIALFILMNLKMQVNNGWTVIYAIFNKNSSPMFSLWAKQLFLCRGVYKFKNNKN